MENPLDDGLKRILEDDLILFEEMKDKYVSENERIFFEIVRHKEIYDFSSMYDLMVLEADNEIEFFFIRQYWNEYEIGLRHGTDAHFDSLKEALEYDMYDLGYTEHITVLEWFRQQDYACVHYDRDNDQQ